MGIMRYSSSLLRQAATTVMSSSALSNVKKTLTAPFVGAFQMLADPLLTEHYAKAGLKAVLIDQQHGLLDERTAFECVQRLRSSPLAFLLSGLLTTLQHSSVAPWTLGLV